jgi:glucosamine-6-phosphate deaminase
MGVYAELVRMHREEGLSFAEVTTFNLDEYFPMHPEALQSYRRYMQEHLFDHIDIDPSSTHLPDGMIGIEDVPAACAAYEERIRDAGGIDLQLLGIGRTGHIGFNEPGSSKKSRTRLITLDSATRIDAASDFFGQEHVPRRAITMGVGTILDARHIILMGFGENKASVIAQAVEGEITPSVAASFLQEHAGAAFYLDSAAAAGLTRSQCPWVSQPDLSWDDQLIRKAVIWVASRVSKPILKLTDEDYNEHHLQELLAAHGPAYDINLHVFKKMQRTITGWPGGKEGRGTFPKRVLVLSPHPDDDVISMGGTLARLAAHGHEVHVAYQVSGAIAVFDEDARRFAEFASEFTHRFGPDAQWAKKLEDAVLESLQTKRPGQVDSAFIQQLKSMIRRGEARSAARICGVPSDRLHFLDMPFYETGRVTKKPLSKEDVSIIADLLREIQPHQIYAAGDLSDPHGTHRTCLQAIEQAILSVGNESWYDDCTVWLYRGAWQEWEPDRIDMAVPLSPDELALKIQAIYRHESQKDRALFPGQDSREFWKRAEERNRATARRYDALGLAEYEAIEAFVQWLPSTGAIAGIVDDAATVTADR